MALAVVEALMDKGLASTDKLVFMLVEGVDTPLAGKEISRLERLAVLLVTHAIMAKDSSPMRSSVLILGSLTEGVVAALAAAAQKGGAEGSVSVLGEVVPAATQAATPMVQQTQVVTTGSQQVLPMQVDTATMPKNDIPNPAKKAKKAPKPSVTMYGYAIEQLMFFEVPTGGAYKPKVDNVKLVKVTVEGDPMSIPDIAECLRRIVPVENFQWEIYNFQNNVFRVKFPNKSEAQRMKAFRTYPVPDRASDLIFEDWSALEDPLYMLPEVWLLVRGIPADVRTDFLSLWAVGTLFGKTKEVDMVHTRKNKELRLRIGCLDHTLIPETTDVFIQRGFFKLSFEVEQVTVTQLGNDNMGNNGGNNGGGGNNGANGDNVDGAKDMDIERTMNNDQHTNANSQQGTAKMVNNTKSAVTNQVQHLVEVPIVFGSLNKALLNKGFFNDNTLSHEDSAPGSEPIRPVAASGSKPAGKTASKLTVGSTVARGVSPVEASIKPPQPSPRDAALTSPPSPPAAPCSLTDAAVGADKTPAPVRVRSAVETREAAAAAVSPPAGGSRVARDHHSVSPKLCLSATGQTAVNTATLGERGLAAGHLSSNPVDDARMQRTSTPVGTATDAVGQRKLSDATFSPGLSVNNVTVDYAVASMTNTGIGIVFGPENLPSPTVVTRQFSGTPTANAIDIEGMTKDTSLANKVAAFGGIAAPSLTARTSDRIRAQPNADATQMERAMQNVNSRHDFSSPGNGKVKHSITSLSNEEIVSKASRLGISMGKNKGEALKAAESIKEVDVVTSQE
ncbi:hypothetical protein ACQ4PT_057414 [Festuca glaucescens]